MTKISQISLFAGSLMLSLPSLRADLPAYEGFDYTNGSDLIQSTGPDGAGGDGWTNRWTGSGLATVVNTNNTITFTDGNGVVYGDGNSVDFSGGSTQNAASRTFLDTNNTDGADIYFSYIFQVTNGSSIGTIDSGSFMSVGVLDSSFNVSTDNFSVITGSKLFSRVNNTSNSIDTDLQYQTTYLAVGRLSGWDGDSYNEMTVWLNPTRDDENNSSISSMSISTTGSDGYRGITFRTFNLSGTGDTFSYDDLRIGDSWDAVVIPEPGTSAMALGACMLLIAGFRGRKSLR